MGIVVTSLTYEDALALAKPKNVVNAAGVAAYSNGAGTVSWRSYSYDTTLNGTTASYLVVEGGKVERGRFFIEDEEKNLSKVAVLGSTAARELFGQSDPVGQHIKIKKQSLEVIGVMAERGQVAFQDYDDQVFLPLKTMQKLIAGVNHLGVIRIKVDHEENVERVIKDIEATLRERHDITDLSGANDDFTVRSAQEALDLISTITDALRYFLAAMAALSLLVGGIGIMNIMLINVTQRTREIGLRKALGADNTSIKNQFLLEAVTMTFLGGVIGIILGIVVSSLIALVARFLEYDWDLSISLLSLFLAVGVSMVVGIIFGLYPARKASRLEPVEALRYE